MGLDQETPPSPDTAFQSGGVKARDAARRSVADEMDHIRRMKKLDRAINRSMRGRSGGGKATERLLKLKASFGGDPFNISGNSILNTEDIETQARANYLNKSEARFKLGNDNDPAAGGQQAGQGAGNAPQGEANAPGGIVPQNTQTGATAPQGTQEMASGGSRLDQPIGTGRISALNGSAESFEEQEAAKRRQSALSGNLGKAAQDAAKRDMAREFIDGANLTGNETPEALDSMKKEMKKNLPPELSGYADSFDDAFDRNVENTKKKSINEFMEGFEIGSEVQSPEEILKGINDKRNSTKKATDAIGEEFGNYLNDNPKKEGESDDEFRKRKDEALAEIKGRNKDALDEDGNVVSSDSAKKKTEEHEKKFGTDADTKKVISNWEESRSSAMADADSKKQESQKFLEDFAADRENSERFFALERKGAAYDYEDETKRIDGKYEAKKVLQEYISERNQGKLWGSSVDSYADDDFSDVDSALKEITEKADFSYFDKKRIRPYIDEQMREKYEGAFFSTLNGDEVYSSSNEKPTGYNPFRSEDKKPSTKSFLDLKALSLDKEADKKIQTKGNSPSVARSKIIKAALNSGYPIHTDKELMADPDFRAELKLEKERRNRVQNKTQGFSNEDRDKIRKELTDFFGDFNENSKSKVPILNLDK